MFSKRFFFSVQQKHQLLDLRIRASFAKMIDGGFCKPTSDDYLNLILMMEMMMKKMTINMSMMMTTMTIMTMTMMMVVVSAMPTSMVIVIMVMQLRTMIRIEFGWS